MKGIATPSDTDSMRSALYWATMLVLAVGVVAIILFGISSFAPLKGLREENQALRHQIQVMDNRMADELAHAQRRILEMVEMDIASARTSIEGYIKIAHTIEMERIRAMANRNYRSSLRIQAAVNKAAVEELLKIGNEIATNYWHSSLERLAELDEESSNRAEILLLEHERESKVKASDRLREIAEATEDMRASLSGANP